MKREDRARLLEMAKRRAQAGSSSDLRIIREARSRHNVAALLPDMRNIAYAIVGGLATARYMPERMTLDTPILTCLTW